jgi:CRISPR-associated protein Cas1
MLGPGTSITHAAIKALAQNNCLLAWTGEQGVRMYAASTGGTFSARRVIRQAMLVSNEQSRLDVACRMYKFRFSDPLPDDISLEVIRGMEGIRVRKVYAEAAAQFSVNWQGRNYDQDEWAHADPINRALSTATACLYGLCHAAILSAGYSPALGFIHTGKMLSFVYDIADLYKTEVVIPLAFRIASQTPADLERVVRLACRDAFATSRLMDRMLPDIAEVLERIHLRCRKALSTC